MRPGRKHQGEDVGQSQQGLVTDLCLGARVRNSINPKLLALEHRELFLSLPLNHHVYIIHRESKDVPASGSISVSI